MSDVKKIWLTADDLLGDSFRLARAVLESGFRPTHLVGIWRGGAPIGIAVQEFFGAETGLFHPRKQRVAGVPA